MTISVLPAAEVSAPDADIEKIQVKAYQIIADKFRDEFSEGKTMKLDF